MHNYCTLSDPVRQVPSFRIHILMDRGLIVATSVLKQSLSITFLNDQMNQ